MSKLTEAYEAIFAEEQKASDWKKALQATLDEVTHQLCAYSLRLDKHTAEADDHLNSIYRMLNGRDIPRPK